MRACRLFDTWPSLLNYKVSVNAEDAPLRARMRELADQRKRWGLPKIHAVLRREELVVNHKRTERIYREEGLLLRMRRRRKRYASVKRGARKPSTRINERWAMDFVADRLWNGRKIRCLTVEDTFTKKCHRIEVDTSLGGMRVVNVLNELIFFHGKPGEITVDNGPEFAGKVLDQWPMRTGLNSILLIRANRLKTASSKASTADSEMSASTNTISYPWQRLEESSRNGERTTIPSARTAA